MHPFLLASRTGIFAEGRFLGKVLDQWIGDMQEFVHAKLPHLIVVVLIALVLGRIISVGTHRMMVLADRENSRPGRNSQLKTFAGVLRTTLHSVLWSLTALQFLMILGVNLGPLLASAGVAGIAIGLAAQTIVKDILNGMLIIIEDQFAVGDSVRLGTMSGKVEAMTLRRTEIRDNDGTLYVVPNSQIATVANLSREYSLATVHVSVDFSASPEMVVPLLTEIALAVRNDPAYADVFLSDPQVLGVDSIKGSEVVYSVTFRTHATRQFAPVREFKRRVRLALEAKRLLPGDPYRVLTGFPGAVSVARDTDDANSENN